MKNKNQHKPFPKTPSQSESDDATKISRQIVDKTLADAEKEAKKSTTQSPCLPPYDRKSNEFDQDVRGWQPK